MTNPLRTVERWLRHQRKRWRHALECRRIMRDAGRVSLDTLAARCSDLERPECVAVSADAAGGPLTTIKNALAGGSARWIALHDASAVICADAMLWIGLALAAQPHCRAVFADHADADGDSVSLHLKPDFSWLYLLANHYLAPLVVYERRTLELAIDRLLERDGEVPTTDAALFAIALEALEDADRSDVLHIRWPLAIAPRRARPAVEADGLPRIAAAALARRGVAARCSHHPNNPHWHAIALERRASPRVSIIIPTKNAASLVKRCVASLRDRAGYDNYELLIIDHDSDERELLEYLAQESTAGRLRVFPYSGPFNYAAMNNAAVRQTAGDLILFLNNDIEDFSAGWLDQLVATIEINTTIAVVGCLLYYPDGDIQHAGVVLNPKHLCIHAHVGLPHDAVGYQGRIRCLQEFSAVTAALMLVRRAAFDAAGGFDEVFPDDYNDVDLCLRLRAAGWRVAYTPHVHAIHWESRTRRVKETAKDVFVSRWQEHFSSDPFYHPRLSHTEFLPDAFAHLWQERKSLALLEAVTQHESRRHPRAS